MHRRPTVSVIIPVYNGERYITEAIESVLSQTWGDFELIVVDDGSTDSTADQVASFGGQVTCIRQCNKGVAAARNVGIATSKGRFIAFLDADDAWVPEKLEKQCKILLSNNRYGAVGCGMVVTNEVLEPQSEQTPNDCELTDLLLVRGNGGLNCSTAMVRREVLEHIGQFDESLSTSADWDLMLRIAMHYAMTSVPEPLVSYRQHENSMHQCVRRTEADMVCVLGKAFSSELPSRHKGLRRLAFSNLYYMLAGSYMHSGDRMNALRCTVACLAWHAGNLPRLSKRIWNQVIRLA